MKKAVLLTSPLDDVQVDVKEAKKRGIWRSKAR
jgi:hypothetical protein